MENQDTRLQQALASLRYIGTELHNRREKLKKERCQHSVCNRHIA